MYRVESRGAQRGKNASYERRDYRRDEPAGQGGPADSDRIQTRNGVNADNFEQPDDAERQADAERAAQQRQKQTLRGNLPEKRGATRAQSAAHRILLLALQS